MDSGLPPVDEGFARRVADDFARQGAMALLGARLARVEPGLVEVALDFRPALSQQHGFFHAGVVASVLDSAGGYAAYGLWEEGSEVLTVEFKLNLLAPAAGTRLLAQGRIVRPGRTLSVCELTAWVEKEGAAPKRCAWGSQTLARRDAAALRKT